MGVEELGIFNQLTLVVLAAVAAVSYLIGNISFQKKDLPL